MVFLSVREESKFIINDNSVFCDVVIIIWE